MEASGRLRELKGQIARGIVGQEELVGGLLTGVLANGHLLIEGVPGLGKTRAVNLLARLCRVAFQRIQFTPDLLPADVIGTRIYNQATGSFETSRGPIFANFVLADEINRAPAKVQSALLETMQERQVTIGRDTIPLAAPFLVFATQNPIEQEGTYPLPEAQLDRFLLKLVVDYPSQSEEEAIVKMVIDEVEPPRLEAVLDGAAILELQAAVREVFLEEKLVRYATDLVQATRRPADYGLELAGQIEIGASPRASIALAQAARATALLEGRDAVLPDDVKAVAKPALRHRIIPTYYAAAEGISTDAIVDEILGAVPVP
ncbi:MAG: MoxR family ATPase [Thermoanaerobaculia bacterium]|nr:MoxR family ATPase [Thermoanaerobaculia bacterium]